MNIVCSFSERKDRKNRCRVHMKIINQMPSCLAYMRNTMLPETSLITRPCGRRIM